MLHKKKILEHLSVIFGINTREAEFNLCVLIKTKQFHASLINL